MVSIFYIDVIIVQRFNINNVNFIKKGISCLKEISKGMLTSKSSKYVFFLAAHGINSNNGMLNTRGNKNDMIA